MTTSLLGLPRCVGIFSLAASAWTADVLTLDGSGFGSKPVVAAVKNLTFQNVADGAGWAACGFDNAPSPGGYINTSATYIHKVTDATFGAALRNYAPSQAGGAFDGSEVFNHLSIDLPPNSMDVQVSFWMRLHVISGTSSVPGYLQQKYVRAGWRDPAYDGSGDMTHLGEYAASPKFAASWEGWSSGPGVASAWGVNMLFVDNDGTPTRDTDMTVPFDPWDGQWHCMKVYYRFNDVGMSNGIVQTSIDGFVDHNRTNVNLRNDATKFIDYVQISPGLANGFAGLETEVLFTRIHVDVGQAAIFVGNASTLAACTGRIYLNPQSWTDTRITASGMDNLPSGYDWVYVTTASGTTNATGYPNTPSGNHAPVATAQSVTTAEDVAASITLAATDADGNPLTYAIATSPTHGTLSGSGASRTYTPSANFSGSDSFTFTANDGTATSAAATVSITVTAVNDTPTAMAQSLSTVKDTAAAITLSGSDPEGSTLSYAIAISPAHGTLSGSGSSRTYTPTAGYTGSDSFTFTVSDGALTSPAATVSITVMASGGGAGTGSASGGGCGAGGAAGLIVGLGMMLRLRNRRR